MDELKKLIIDIHNNAKAHGWYDEKRSFGEIIALIHSELSEALEFERNKNKFSMVDYQFHYSGGGYIATAPTLIAKKPDGVIPELADVVIRVFDYIGSINRVDEFLRALNEKHQYNKSRPFKHGGKTI